MNKEIFIQEMESVKDALKKLDKTAEKVLLVVDNKRKLLGTITDGDIRRYILKGESLDDSIINVYNKNPFYLEKERFSIETTKSLLIKNKIELLPILDKRHRVVDFVTWSQAFSKKRISKLTSSNVNIPIVIMAGGKGKRLDPFSKIFPKPLIPIGDRPIIEIIIGEFRKQGVQKYYLTLNHKGEMIQSYFNTIEKKGYEVKYVWEDSFLGTAGSLKLVEREIEEIFIVSNCDVIVRANLEEVLNFHKEQKALLTILSSIQHYKIPYGVVKFKTGGEVTDIMEKPEYTFTVNTGVYVLSKESLQFIPENSPFDMTELARAILKRNKKVVIYPVNENDYIDVGQWDEYKKALEKLHLFK